MEINVIIPSAILVDHNSAPRRTDATAEQVSMGWYALDVGDLHWLASEHGITANKRR